MTLGIFRRDDVNNQSVVTMYPALDLPSHMVARSAMDGSGLRINPKF